MQKILIVEDHESLSLSLKTFLDQESYQTEQAENLKSARQKLINNPDLIILDWMLPDGQGVDFLDEIRTSPGT